MTGMLSENKMNGDIPLDRMTSYELNSKKGFIDIKKVKNWFSTLLDKIAVCMVILAVITLYFLENSGFYSFDLGSQAISVLGTILQSLASIFAIVFSISLVAIQMCSENLSHRLIDLYVKDRNFLIPALINFVAIMVDFSIITNEELICYANWGIRFSFVAIFSFISFFVFSVRFLRPVFLVSVLLDRVGADDILTKNYVDKELYRESLQPIEDIASNCIRKGDYATAQDVITLISDKMNVVFSVVNERLKMEGETRHIVILVYMSRPFSKLLEGIAISSNKRDSIETTIYIINIISDFVKKFEEARFVPAFHIFRESIERMYSQASHRFRSDEYRIDFARLEVAIADARVSFSEFVV